MRISFHGAKVRVVCSERESLRFRAYASRIVGVKERAAVDSRHAVSLPELQRIGCAEEHCADVIRFAQKITLEDIWRPLIETPVVQRDTRIDCLQLAFEVEQVSTMPRQKSGRAVRLW